MLFEPWRQDLRLAWVGLRRARAFSGAAVLTMALGMTGNTAMFALMEGVLLRPLPVREQDRLIVAWKEFPSGTFAHWPFRSREVDAISRESRLLERVAGVSYYGAGPLSLDALLNRGPVVGQTLDVLPQTASSPILRNKVS